ncbi:SRPBCC family protein [Stenotrophomonas geniculata]|nr:SRPBCC family protein [Stenotrophomonas geniculata]MCR1803912.1 SRPBCC family protein [Stenotrophomonas geniculata]
MATASVSITVPTPAAQVWNLIGGFDSLPDWLPYIPRSALSEGGRVRHLANPDGDTIVERLEAFDQADRSYTYSILQAPFPVTGYRSTLRVVAQGSGSRIDWSGEFTPVGVSDEEASALFEGIYRDGLKALETTLAG